MLYHHRLNHYLARDVARHSGLPLWLAFRCLPAIILGGMLLLLLWLLSAAPTRAMTDSSESPPDLNGLQSSHMLLRDAATGAYTPAFIQSSKVHFDISGMIATVSLQQTFRNDSERWMEGVYGFPLPDNAAVRKLEMVIGERRIIGKVREKAEAKALYQQAKKAGKKASLVEQQRPNLFTNRVANIGPKEEITVYLEYVQQVGFLADTFSLRFPMTLTPRYMPGASLAAHGALEEEVPLALNPYLGWARPTSEVPDADAISPVQHAAVGSDRQPLNPVEITATLDMGMPLAQVESPYHEIALARSAGVYSVRLANGLSEMDRDFVLNWQPVTGATPAAALFTERVGEEYFGLLLVVPPVSARHAAAMAREVVFVVDTSGSMGGVSIQQARASVSQALQQLRPQDYFNIIEFNSQHRALYRRPMPATRHHVQQAQEFVRLLQASGGTEMLPALGAALQPPKESDMHAEQALLRQIIFITDGAVGNELALFEEISARLGDNRLFTVGIGSAPNSWFMRKAAQYGRGTHTHIGNLDEVGAKMGDLFDRLSRPVAIDFKVRWPSAVEAWPQRIPDLYAGEPVSVAVNFGVQPPAGDIHVSAEINGQPWRQALQLSTGADPVSSATHRGVASLWARAKIAGLLDQKVTGREEAAVRQDVLGVALQHQLLSPYTSFIAIEELVSRPAGEGLSSKPVANTRPRGQSPQVYAYPRTATTAPAKAWFAVLALFLAMMLCVLRRPEVDHVPLARA